MSEAKDGLLPRPSLLKKIQAARSCDGETDTRGPRRACALMTRVAVPVLPRPTVDHIIDGVEPRPNVSNEGRDDDEMGAARNPRQVLRQLFVCRSRENAQGLLERETSASAQNGAHPFGRLRAPGRGTEARVC